MSHFNLTWQQMNLELRQPFTIARDTKKTVHNVLIKLGDGKTTGYGEAAPNVRYDEDADKVIGYLQAIPDDFFDDINAAEKLSSKLDDHFRADEVVQSARVAVEMAWLDWLGKTEHQPLWKMWGAPRPVGPVSSYTIGLDSLEVMQKKVKKAADFPLYKVKLGTDRDRQIIQAIREVTDKPIRIDANEGWETLDHALEMIRFLEDKNIEFVEQPMPADRIADYPILKRESPLLLCADESFMGGEPLADISQGFDIINIKLMKTGSMVKAKKIIDDARKHDLQIMIGCMVESSIANAAGGLLSLWADYCDLDGHLLIKDDPAGGFNLTDEKRIKLTEEPGLGVEMVNGDL